MAKQSGAHSIGRRLVYFGLLLAAVAACFLIAEKYVSAPRVERVDSTYSMTGNLSGPVDCTVNVRKEDSGPTLEVHEFRVVYSGTDDPVRNVAVRTLDGDPIAGVNVDDVSGVVTCSMDLVARQIEVAAPDCFSEHVIIELGNAEIPMTRRLELRGHVIGYPESWGSEQQLEVVLQPHSLSRLPQGRGDAQSFNPPRAGVRSDLTFSLKPVIANDGEAVLYYHSSTGGYRRPIASVPWCPEVNFVEFDLRNFEPRQIVQDIELIVGHPEGLTGRFKFWLECPESGERVGGEADGQFSDDTLTHARIRSAPVGSWIPTLIQHSAGKIFRFRTRAVVEGTRNIELRIEPGGTLAVLVSGIDRGLIDLALRPVFVTVVDLNGSHFGSFHIKTPGQELIEVSNVPPGRWTGQLFAPSFGKLSSPFLFTTSSFSHQLLEPALVDATKVTAVIPAGLHAHSIRVEHVASGKIAVRKHMPPDMTRVPLSLAPGEYVVALVAKDRDPVVRRVSVPSDSVCDLRGL